MPSPAPVGDLLGRQWIESEKDFRGTWTRRGTSNVFDAVWEGGYQAVLTMTLIGNNVRIVRQGADATCRYDGTILGNQASGQYTCTSFSGIGTWAAEIR
ncbi:MAG: hypothetical protein DHS20C11_20230 [Lysobacteraceae bacterium]|nr:MAG: hypothetical protein DHS20C11_20230 [Xanthomonadaceae bacterium]